MRDYGPREETGAPKETMGTMKTGKLHKNKNKKKIKKITVSFEHTTF